MHRSHPHMASIFVCGPESTIRSFVVILLKEGKGDTCEEVVVGGEMEGRAGPSERE